MSNPPPFPGTQRVGVSIDWCINSIIAGGSFHYLLCNLSLLLTIEMFSIRLREAKENRTSFFLSFQYISGHLRDTVDRSFVKCGITLPTSGQSIAKSILVATRTTWSRYCFMMMNKCNSKLRLYNETHEDIYGLAVNNKEKNHLSHYTGVKFKPPIVLKLRQFHPFQLYMVWLPQSKEFHASVFSCYLMI